MKRKLWILLALAAALALLCCASALADQSGSCGNNVNWTLKESTGLLTISGTGKIKDFSNTSDIPWYNSRESITKVVIDSGVTRIGGKAFYYCTNLASVTIPDSVTSIGYLAFSGCDGLTSVTIPKGVDTISYKAFKNCNGLNSVTILNPDSVIGDQSYDVFEGCPISLVLYGWPDSTAQTYAGNAHITFHAFAATGSCGANTEFLFDVESGRMIISGPWGEAMDEYDELSAVPWYNYRSTITTVMIQSGVTNIGRRAFYDCVNLTNVLIPGTVTSIGYLAFSGCAGLTGVLHIPDSVTSIGYLAFRGCTGLTSVIIRNPNCVIGDNDHDVFESCSAGLVLHGWPGSTAQAFAADAHITFDAYAVSGSCGADATYSFDPVSGTLTISGTGAMTNYINASEVPWYDYCWGISATVINSGMTSIGSNAFCDCSGLTGMIIPSSVTSIGAWAFWNCTSLTNMNIPKSVASIGYMAFRGCTRLTSVIIQNPGCTIGDNEYDVFNECPSSLVLYGWPDSTAKIYAKAAGHSFSPLDEKSAFTLPAKLTALNQDAFQGIAAKAVLIPADVTEISGNPFIDGALRIIYGYAGTAAETFANAYGFAFIPINP